MITHRSNALDPIPRRPHLDPIGIHISTLRLATSTSPATHCHQGTLNGRGVKPSRGQVMKDVTVVKRNFIFL